MYDPLQPLASQGIRMFKLAAMWNTIPGSQQETLSWVEHVAMMTKMIPGDACPINEYLLQLHLQLKHALMFTG
jgi:hypothetical protein